jgi:hypothetical protein
MGVMSNVMKVGYTGIVNGGTNPATGDCCWQALILKIGIENSIYIQLEDGTEKWICVDSFTPKYIRMNHERAHKRIS